MIALVLLLFSIIILFEVPGLVKKRMWRELAAFSAYMFMGMVLSIPQVLGVRLPNPTTVIEMIFRPFAELLK